MPATLHEDGGGHLPVSTGMAISVSGDARALAPRERLTGVPAPPPAYSGAPTAQVTKAASHRTRVALPAETRIPVTVMLGPSAKETVAL